MAQGYICDHCGKGFGSHPSFKVDIKIHDNPGPVQDALLMEREFCSVKCAGTWLKQQHKEGRTED